MTYDNEALVRHAYHTAEGDVLDVAGFVGSFAEDGVINLGHAGREASEVGQESYRGEQLGELVLFIAKLFPDVHRELHRVNVLGDTVAVEVSIQGTFRGPLETPAGIVQPTGVKVDVPTADFWYLRDGKIEMFDCYVMVSTMYAQMACDARLRVGGCRAHSRALSRSWSMWCAAPSLRSACQSCPTPGVDARVREPDVRGRGARQLGQHPCVDLVQAFVSIT
jgi:ketosteroid isomerase-like protein